MYRRSLEGWKKHWDFILLDALCLQIAYILSYSYRFGYNRFVYTQADYRIVGMLLFLFGFFATVFFNTMHSVIRRGIMNEIRKSFAQCMTVFAAVVIALFSTKDSAKVSRIVLYTTLIVYFFISFFARLLYKEFLIRNRLVHRSRELLIVSDREGAEQAIKRINDFPEDNIHICGLVLVDDDKAGEIAGVSVVANIDNVSSYILTEWVEEVYIAVSRYENVPEKLIYNCDEMAVTVHQNLFPQIQTHGDRITQKIAGEPVLTCTAKTIITRESLVKRTFDIITGFFMCILALLALVIVTPVIKIEAPGPVLLKFRRIGRYGKEFTMYNIRSMYLDSQERLAKWREKHGDEKLIEINDPRIIGNSMTGKGSKTGIGVIIRRWGIQSLPIGFNILIGQMSLVGTRAPSLEEWEKYEFHHRARLACKPGLIGLWQVERHGKVMDFEEATKLDTEYISNWSLGLDLKILLRVLMIK